LIYIVEASIMGASTNLALTIPVLANPFTGLGDLPVASIVSLASK
jgi:hypothetical protein